MASFLDSLKKLQWVLENYPALQSYAQSAWGKPLAVRRAFKKKIELNVSEFPLCLITRPRVAKSFNVGERDGAHDVNLYLGFQQQDRELAQDQLVELEELIDDAILANYTLGDTAIMAMPTSSENDEGESHPSYFMAIGVKVQHKR